MLQTKEREETLLNEKELKSLMLGVCQKFEDQELQTDRQIIDEVLNRLRPLVHPTHD